MFARGRVLVIKVSENSCKWLREGGRVISRACVRERHLGRECVSMCERPSMESETTRKRLMYTLIKDINCIQILGWDHDICNSRKERSLIHQTSRFYRIWACLCYYSTQLIHIVSILNSRQCIALAIEYKHEYSSCCACKAHYTYESYTMNIINSYLWTSIHFEFNLRWFKKSNSRSPFNYLNLISWHL